LKFGFGGRQILVVMAMLVRVLNLVPAACGLASTIALIPASIYTGRKLAGIRKRLMMHTDARIKLCSEVVTGELLWGRKWEVGLVGRGKVVDDNFKLWLYIRPLRRRGEREGGEVVDAHVRLSMISHTWKSGGGGNRLFQTFSCQLVQQSHD
jgi:hypothetical protein